MPNSVNGRCYCQVDGICLIWNVDGCPLLFLADVIANGMWQMFLPLQCIAVIDWLMLLPSGRWNSHMLLICFLCCMGQMLLPCGRWNSHILYICDGRCYCPVADGMATAR